MKKKETVIIPQILPARPIEKEDNKVGKFKRSGHLTDMELKYNYPKNKGGQLSIFDILGDKTIKDIDVSGVDRSEVVEGIRLSPSETKVIDCLCKLLHHNSEIFDPKGKDYYTGNLKPEIVEYMDSTTPAPKLSFTLYKLAKEYTGGVNPSGKEIENIKKVLIGLDSKKFLIRYTENIKGKGGEWIKREYEKFRPIIHLDKATLSYGVGDVEHYRKSELVIVLHPIFRRQIDSKFILYPNDIVDRTNIAYGSPNVSSVTLKLRDYLMRELSSKHYKPEIGVEKLYYQVGEKWMKQSRKSKVKQYTEKAIETVTNLGLLESYEIKSGATGEDKIIFTLNKKWE